MADELVPPKPKNPHAQVLQTMQTLAVAGRLLKAPPNAKKNPHAQMLGRITSPHKARQARINGRLGGRKRKGPPVIFAPKWPAGTRCAFCECDAVAIVFERTPACPFHRASAYDVADPACPVCGKRGEDYL